MKKIFLLNLIALAIITVLTGCAYATNVEPCINPAEHTYGFWGGVWHGMIMVPSFIGSLFYDDIAIYAINNNGGWYNFGYVGGLTFLLKVVAAIFSDKKS